MAKTNHTDPGHRTQMRNDTFLKQLADCYYSDMVVNQSSQSCIVPYGRLKVRDKIERKEQSQNNIKDNIFFCGSRYDMRCLGGDGGDCWQILVTWNGRKPLKSFDDSLIETVGKRLWLNNRAKVNGLTKDSKVKGYTKMKQGDYLYRAHPSYRKENEWFDWVGIKWEGIEDPVPAQIKSFIDLSQSRFQENQIPAAMVASNEQIELLQPSKYVIVQSALSPVEDVAINGPYRIEDCNAKRFRLEKKWRILPIESIVCPIYVIQEHPSQCNDCVNEYVVINDKTTWYDSFLHKDK